MHTKVINISLLILSTSATYFWQGNTASICESNLFDISHGEGGSQDFWLWLRNYAVDGWQPHLDKGFVYSIVH